MKWLYGILCLFFLIIFHEFGHFIAAKLFGVHPLKRAAIGFAGPFFNLIFAVLCLSLINGIGYTYYSYSNKIILAEELYEGSSQAARIGGLLTGDTITAINGKPTEDFSQIIEEVSTRPDEDLIITVERNGSTMSFTVHSELDKESGTGKIGVAADTENLLECHTPEYNFFQSIGHGFLDTFEYIGLTFKSIAILFKGVDLKNAVGGPARITEMLGSTAQEGFSAGFKVGFISLSQLMAVISISLFIMNLLPIPVLDGGLILVALIETISRKKVPPKVQYRIQFIGFAFIAILFIIGLIGDINYFISGAKLK